MITNATGSMVIVDLNTENPKYFWKGIQLMYVVGLLATVVASQKKLSIRVKKPTSVPGLTPEQIANLNTIYTEMAAAGIFITKEN